MRHVPIGPSGLSGWLSGLSLLPPNGRIGRVVFRRVTRLFGTDGVRGLANADLTPEVAMGLSMAAIQVLSEEGAHGSTTGRPLAIVGRDPRASGEMLEAATVAGLTSAGADVVRVGVLPTPAVAFLTDRLGADLGVMISASHNAMPDNGIKFFARGGHKLDDSVEDRIEERMGDEHAGLGGERLTGVMVGRVRDNVSGAGEYVHHVLHSVGVIGNERPLAGLKVVIDGANGAAALVAPDALARAGADVTAIHCTPDGANINENCGSTHMGDLIRAVIETRADVGIAHDGDADRCLAVAADGTLVDGDHILAILGSSMHRAGTLAGGTIATTVMANLGFFRAMESAGIKVMTTAVGDRYVLDAMREHKLVLGGEQSGHVILGEHATTGDGLLTAFHLLKEVATSGKSLAELASIVTKYPQVLINVKGVDRAKAADNPELLAAVAEQEAILGDDGCVLLRPSGTEPVVRVMVEAADQATAQQVAEHLAEVVRATCR
jgi:phosphoglucosamine mutase